VVLPSSVPICWCRGWRLNKHRVSGVKCGGGGRKCGAFGGCKVCGDLNLEIRGRPVVKLAAVSVLLLNVPCTPNVTTTLLVYSLLGVP
jgi:hypothetical protein